MCRYKLKKGKLNLLDIINIFDLLLNFIFITGIVTMI